MITLPRQKSGDLTGYPVLKGNQALFNKYAAKTISMGIQYGFGSKDSQLGIYPPDYSEIDCSGEVRTILAYATNGQTTKLLRVPDGSFMQDDYFRAEAFKHYGILTATDYINAVHHKDAHMRVCFHRPAPSGRGGDTTGHVWFVYYDPTIDPEPITYESYGHHGPGHRPYNHLWFLQHCDDVYVLW